MLNEQTPLAERMRPTSLNEYVGQRHLVGENGVIKSMITRGAIPSMIFWGPPGVGKTTLAELIALHVKRPFYRLSAIHSGVKDIREVIDKAGKNDLFSGSGNPVLFVDEIHRFSKSQQDSLLGAVEKGIITLVGATTENPSFEVIPALLSRCQVYTLKPLDKSDLIHLLEMSIQKDADLKSKNITLAETEELLLFSGGDARKLLNTLELLVNGKAGPVEITNAMVKENLKENTIAYDKTGEMHYDIISAMIKSIRGSDPNGAVYWLARMVEGGEDPKFIASRLLIAASEDIGNANPTALIMANNTFQAVHTIGYPESRIILAQCVTYLATSPKSNAAYEAIGNAQNAVRETGNLAVPMHLRNAPTQLMKELGYGEAYKYSHAYEGNFEAQEYLPDELKGTAFYQPGNNAREEQQRQFLKERWKEKYGY
jgi:putative ATPase